MALAADRPLHAGFTVLIETEWVLRSRYGLTRPQIVDALVALPDLLDVRFEHETDVRWAIDRYAVAGELADYLPVAAFRRIGRLATLERRLARWAGPDAPSIMEVLP